MFGNQTLGSLCSHRSLFSLDFDKNPSPISWFFYHPNLSLQFLAITCSVVTRGWGEKVKIRGHVNFHSFQSWLFLFHWYVCHVGLYKFHKHTNSLVSFIVIFFLYTWTCIESAIIVCRINNPCVCNCYPKCSLPQYNGD